MRKAQRIAALMDAERSKLERRGIRAVTPTLLRARVAAIRAVKRGANPAQAAADVIRTTAPVLQEGMMAGYLQGRLRAMSAIKTRPTIRADRAGYGDEVNRLLDRLRLNARDIAGLRQRFGPLAVDATNDVAAAVKQTLDDAVAEAIRERDTTAGAVNRIRKALDGSGVGASANVPSLPLIETQFRTQLQTAYGAGQWQADQAPEIQEILFGYEYVTVGDDRVRPSHALLDGARYPKEHPFWEKNACPNGWNCRCQMVAIYHDEPQATLKEAPGPTEIDGVMVTPGADPGFDFNPGIELGELLRA